MEHTNKGPILYVVVGPNGSGKSSITKSLGIDEQLGERVVNPDLIANNLDIEDPVKRSLGAADINESRTVDMLFRNPYVSSADLVEELGVSNPTALKVLRRLESEGVQREVSGRKRNLLFRVDGVM